MMSISRRLCDFLSFCVDDNSKQLTVATEKNTVLMRGSSKGHGIFRGEDDVLSWVAQEQPEAKKSSDPTGAYPHDTPSLSPSITRRLCMLLQPFMCPSRNRFRTLATRRILFVMLPTIPLKFMHAVSDLPTRRTIAGS